MEASAISRAAHRLDEQTLRDDLSVHAFGPSFGPPHVGLEIEMLVVRDQRAISVDEFLEAIAPLLELHELEDATLPGAPPCFRYGSTSLTFEPGGQIEIVSAPQTSIARALEDIAKLEMLLDRVLLWRGMRRLHVGINPWQHATEIELQTPLPRYQAMHEYFSRIGPEGARMMRLCCAIQINLDTGSPTQVSERWYLANLMSPIFGGMFANSPLAGGDVSGWKSSRAGVWRGVDPSRTGILASRDGPGAYLQFALEAGMLLRRTDSGYLSGKPGLTFCNWMQESDGPGPTIDDWHYHLTTLFPHVRPRGYFELRSIDALPVRWRAVPVAIASALLMDDEARQTATELLEPHRERLGVIGLAAARAGLDDPTVAKLAQSLMATATQAFPRLPEEWISADIAATVHAFDELYTARSRCPADGVLESPGDPFAWQ